jgi:ABC-2 type transport system ATP-binding protein
VTPPDVIATEALTRFYGRHRGIEDVTFQVQRGESASWDRTAPGRRRRCGRCSTSSARPAAAALFGLDSREASVEIRRRVGYLPGELALYEHMTAEDHLMSPPPAWIPSSSTRCTGLIAEARSDGRTVFLSSHILPEVEALCDRVGIIRRGRLAAVERIGS